MPNVLTNVLGEIKDIAKGMLPNLPVDYNTAPPANRDITVAYAPLVRKLADGTKVNVGTFLPEHFVLANADSLACQILAAEWKTAREANKLPVEAADLKKDRPDLYKALYREENDVAVLKTAFELAMCPSHKQRTIELFIEKEYLFRRDRDLPLPAMVSKFRVGPDYLKNIGDAGLEQKEFPGNCKINIINPTPTRREKIMHYLAQNMSYLVTISAALGAVGLISEVMLVAGLTSPWILGAGVVGAYLAKKTGNDFGLYDVAEALFRDLGWMTNKKLATGKFSLKNAIGTGIYALAIASTVALAVYGTWVGTFALPWVWPLLAKTGIGAAAVTAAQVGFAGLFSAVAGLGAALGTAFTVRYFWGLSVYDNQIALDKKVADAIPEISTAKGFKASLEKQQAKILAKFDKPKYGFSEQEREAMTKEVSATFTNLQNRFGARPGPSVSPVTAQKELAQVLATEAQQKVELRRSPRNHPGSAVKA